MKIACITTSRIPSSTANSIQVMKACQGLAKLGHEVHLFCPDNPEARVPWQELADRYGLSESFPVTWLPSRPALRRNDFAWLAVLAARRLKADWIYTWTGQSAVFSLLWGIPVAYEIHDLPTGSLGPVWFRLFLRLAGQKRILPITHALRKALETRFGGLPDEQVVISPNGVDLEQYEDLPSPPEARRILGLAEAVTVLCAGHLYAGRGLDLFFGLAEAFPQASFVWVGGRAEDVNAAESRVRQKGLNNVTFTGFINNSRLPCYQAAADILLMPYGRTIAGSGGGNSADICSPMKMFDYLAAGRAILSSDLPVIREVLDERSALFAQPEDLPDWCSSLARLLAEPDLRRSLGNQARLNAQHYTWKARAGRIFPSSE